MSSIFGKCCCPLLAGPSCDECCGCGGTYYREYLLTITNSTAFPSCDTVRLNGPFNLVKSATRPCKWISTQVHSCGSYNIPIWLLEWDAVAIQWVLSYSSLIFTCSPPAAPPQDIRYRHCQSSTNLCSAVDDLVDWDCHSTVNGSMDAVCTCHHKANGFPLEWTLSPNGPLLTCTDPEPFKAQKAEPTNLIIPSRKRGGCCGGKDDKPRHVTIKSNSQPIRVKRK